MDDSRRVVTMANQTTHPTEVRRSLVPASEVKNTWSVAIVAPTTLDGTQVISRQLTGRAGQ